MALLGGSPNQIVTVGPPRAGQITRTMTMTTTTMTMMIQKISETFVSTRIWKR